MDKPVAAAPTGAKEKVEKQARQLAYDVRYKTKQSMAQKSGGRLDPAQVQKAYMSQLAKSPAPPAVKSRAKQMLMGEDYKAGIDKLVSDSAASALFKVFVEHHQKDKDGNTIPHEVEEINEEEKQYKVRVTDKKTNNSYVRMATRAKISELRSNPNISSVEMTEYGTPTKSEKLKGKQTADAKKGKLAKKDYDGDGKIETGTQEYMGSRDKAIKKAMATRKEEYSWRDGFAELIEKKEKEKKITGEGVDNSKLIKVFPDEVKEQMMDQQSKPDPQLAQKEKKQAMLKKQVLMKKLQAVRAGAGSDITSSYEPEGENVEEKATYGGERVYYSDDARKRAMQKDAQATENRIAARERAAAKRRKDRNQLRKQGQFGAQGKYYVTKRMEKESVEMNGSQFVEDMGEKEHERETKKQIGDLFKAPSSSSAEAGDIARRKAKNKAALKRSEQGAARRKENRNYLRSVGKYKGPMEGVEMKPEDKTPENAGDITFDAGGAIPATIKAIGDPRELETAMKLKKTQLRASGLNMSHELEGDELNEKNRGDQELRKKAKGYDSFTEKRPISKKEQGTRAVIGRRNTTGAMNRGGIGYAKPDRETKERRERHKADRGVKTKGTKAGHSGSAYPKKSATMDTMYPHKKKHRLSMMAKDKKSGIKRPGGRAKFYGTEKSGVTKLDKTNEAYVVTQSDKTGNTKAYQDMKAGKKNQITGEPLYKKADHMKENLVTIEKFNNVANINVKPSNYNSEKDLINKILNQ